MKNFLYYYFLFLVTIILTGYWGLLIVLILAYKNKI